MAVLTGRVVNSLDATLLITLITDNNALRGITRSAADLPLNWRQNSSFGLFVHHEFNANVHPPMLIWINRGGCGMYPIRRRCSSRAADLDRSISEQNISRYRKLLDPRVDEAQRSTILVD